MNFFLLLNTFWRMLVTKQLTVATDFHSIFPHTMEVNGYRQLFGYQHSSKYLILCSAAEKDSYRFATTWGWVNDVHFWVNYPFKDISRHLLKSCGRPPRVAHWGSWCEVLIRALFLFDSAQHSGVLKPPRPGRFPWQFMCTDIFRHQLNHPRPGE